MVRKNRFLTSEEINRVLIIEKIKKKFIALGYSIEETYYSKIKVFVVGLILNIVIVITSIYLYISFNDINFMEYLDIKYIILFLLSIYLLYFLHEFIKYICFGLFCKEHYKSVELYFIKRFIPNSICLEPLNKPEYIFCLVIPILLLGLAPIIISINHNLLYMFVIGLLGIIECSLDFYSIIKIMSDKNRYTMYLKHPSESGFIIMKKII